MSHEMVLKTVKQILKKKGFQYKDLKSHMGLSESGIKKLLTGKDISLKRLSQILEVLGMELADIFKLISEQEVKHVQLSKKQEQSLFENHSLFRVFWQLTIEEKSLEQIQKSEKISRLQLEKFLLKLENLDLVKRNSKAQIVSTHKGLYRWVGDDSALLKKLHHEWSLNTLEKVLKNKKNSRQLYRLSYLQLSPNSRDEFFKRLMELADDFARRSQREKLENSTDKLIPISLLFALDSSGFLDP